MGERYWKIRKYFYVALALMLAISFYQKDNYKTITPVTEEEFFHTPIQMEIADGKDFSIVKENYNYTVHPIYDYDIRGLVVSTYNYDSFATIENAELFTTDLCIIYGDILKNGIYRNSDIRFSSSGRFCYWNYSSESAGKVDPREITNNHMVINSPKILSVLHTIEAGDLIRIKGKLVNIEASALRPLAHGVYTHFIWKSSTTRDDTGAGACETIYVEDLEIIKRGHSIYFWMYRSVLWGLGTLVSMEICLFFFGVFRSDGWKARYDATRS